MVTERQGRLLEALVREYISTAEAVASERLSLRLRFSASPATVRNEMAALEEAGFLSQPHTSAGRIPTEQGYRYYIEHCLGKGAGQEISWKELRELRREAESEEQLLKEVAKRISELTEEAALIGFGRRDVYYTGLSYLLGQPEFHELARLVTLASILDHVDEVMRSLYDEVGSKFEIRLGSDSPFGIDCGTILVKVHYGRRPGSVGVLGLLGPMRMDYERNLSVLRGVQEVFGKLIEG